MSRVAIILGENIKSTSDVLMGLLRGRKYK